jgi:hypothetical protein
MAAIATTSTTSNGCVSDQCIDQWPAAGAKAFASSSDFQ